MFSNNLLGGSSGSNENSGVLNQNIGAFVVPTGSISAGNPVDLRGQNNDFIIINQDVFQVPPISFVTVILTNGVSKTIKNNVNVELRVRTFNSAGADFLSIPTGQVVTLFTSGEKTTRRLNTSIRRARLTKPTPQNLPNTTFTNVTFPNIVYDEIGLLEIPNVIGNGVRFPSYVLRARFFVNICINIGSQNYIHQAFVKNNTSPIPGFYEGNSTKVLRATDNPSFQDLQNGFFDVPNTTDKYLYSVFADFSNNNNNLGFQRDLFISYMQIEAECI